MAAPFSYGDNAFAHVPNFSEPPRPRPPVSVAIETDVLRILAQTPPDVLRLLESLAQLSPTRSLIEAQTIARAALAQSGEAA